MADKMDTHAAVLVRKDEDSEALSYSLIESFPSLDDARLYAKAFAGEPEDVIAVTETRRRSVATSFGYVYCVKRQKLLKEISQRIAALL